MDVTEDRINNSQTNWDMEYKDVSLLSPKCDRDTSIDYMDVSNSNTPKSKIFTSQRKKLSDSFPSEDEENETKDSYFLGVNNQDIKQRATSTMIASNNTTDQGYHTVSSSTECSSWSCSNVYASTPTKLKM